MNQSLFFLLGRGGGSGGSDGGGGWWYKNFQLDFYPQLFFPGRGGLNLLTQVILGSGTVVDRSIRKHRPVSLFISASLSPTRTTSQAWCNSGGQVQLAESPLRQIPTVESSRHFFKCFTSQSLEARNTQTNSVLLYNGAIFLTISYHFSLYSWLRSCI